MKQSNRKLYNVMIGLLICACQIIPLTLVAQDGKIPITTSSEDALKLFLKGRDHFEFVENAEAAQCLEKAIEKDHNFGLAYLYRFRTNIGGAKVAHNYLMKAVDLSDQLSPGERYFILFIKAGADGDGSKQKEYLDKLLDLFPSDKRVQYEAGIYYRFVERKTALNYYKRVIELDESFAPVYDIIAFSYSSLGDLEQAEKAFLSEINLAPERPNPHDSYGYFLTTHGRFDEAINQFTLAFEIDTTFTGALSGLGLNYLYKEEFKTAREYFEKALEKTTTLQGYGGKFSTLNILASSFILEGNIDKALNTYKRYRSLAQENNLIEEIITSFQNEGLILIETNNLAEGLKRYQMAVKIVNQPDTPEEIKKERTLQCMFTECYALQANNNLEAAYAKLEDCKKIAKTRNIPDDQKWIDLLMGLMESKKGNHIMAIEHYSKSWTNNTLVKYYMYEDYKKMDQPEKASKLHDELKNLNPTSIMGALAKYRLRENFEE